MEDPITVLKPHAPVTVPPSATVGEAMKIMLAHDIGALLVVDPANKLLGIFSERDLLNTVSGEMTDYAARPVSDLMTSNPETASENYPLAFALHKMDCGGFRHLPVVRDGKPVGMISVRDLIRHITHLCKDRFAGD